MYTRVNVNETQTNSKLLKYHARDTGERYAHVYDIIIVIRI